MLGLKSKIKSLIMMVKEEKFIPIPTPIDTTKLLNGKVGLVIGGTGGIGKAIAKAFLRNGAKVIITGTSNEKVQQCLSELGGGWYFVSRNGT